MLIQQLTPAFFRGADSPRIAARLSAENQRGTSAEKCKFSVSRTVLCYIVLVEVDQLMCYLPVVHHAHPSLTASTSSSMLSSNGQQRWWAVKKCVAYWIIGVFLHGSYNCGAVSTELGSAVTVISKHMRRFIVEIIPQLIDVLRCTVHFDGHSILHRW